MRDLINRLRKHATIADKTGRPHCNLLIEAADRIAELERQLAAQQPAQSEDAEKYQWLRQRFVGYDFEWGEPPMIVACFEVGKDFRGGRDIGAAINKAIQETSK